MLALAGCAVDGATPDDDRAGPWVRWVCDSQSELYWRFADETRDVVEIRLGDSSDIYRLHQEPDADGVFYSDGMLAFETRGESGLVYWLANDRQPAKGCEAP